MELVCFVSDKMTNVHLKVKVANDSHKTVLFFVETEDVFFQVEAELEFVAALLNEKHIFARIEQVVAVKHALDPLVEDVLLVLGQPRLQRLASLAQRLPFLLRFPVLTKNFANFILIELELGLELVHPDNFV